MNEYAINPAIKNEYEKPTLGGETGAPSRLGNPQSSPHVAGESMKILTIALVPFLAVYAGIICRLFRAIILRPRDGSASETIGDQYPGVSVVVPFRNEAPNLRRLIESLDTQRYPGDVEILLVNDGSTDDYREALAAGRCRRTPRIIDSAYTPARPLTSKQQALDLGIAAATHDMIALTDADMRLDPEWLSSLVKQMRRGADLVFGHTVIAGDTGSALFTWFQRFQLEILFAVAFAFNRSDIAGSCMGNNLMISRMAYRKIGGFDAMGYTITEDRELLVRFRREKLRVAAVEPFRPTAMTFPVRHVREYKSQLLRWAYGGLKGDSNLSFFALVALVQNCALLLTGAGLLGPYAAILTFGNFALTWLFFAVALEKIGSRENRLLFAPFYLLFIIEAAMVSALFIFKRRVEWKNRKL
jgi:cellulose synthase/poly-beta-1,6-N-acetylglucosamine synthase-like glycosyltransferase